MTERHRTIRQPLLPYIFQGQAKTNSVPISQPKPHILITEQKQLQADFGLWNKSPLLDKRTSQSLAASSLRAVIKQVTARHAAAVLVPSSFAVARRLQSSACCGVSHDKYHDPYNAIRRGPSRAQRIRMHEEEIGRIKREARERMERDLVELRRVRRSLESEGVRGPEVDGRVGPVMKALRELREVKGGSLMGEKGTFVYFLIAI